MWEDGTSWLAWRPTEANARVVKARDHVTCWRRPLQLNHCCWCARWTLPALPDVFVINALDGTLRMTTINTILMTAKAHDLLTESSESEPSVCRSRMHSWKLCHTLLRQNYQDTNTNNQLQQWLQKNATLRAVQSKAITVKPSTPSHSCILAILVTNASDANNHNWSLCRPREHMKYSHPQLEFEGSNWDVPAWSRYIWTLGSRGDVSGKKMFLPIFDFFGLKQIFQPQATLQTY